MTTPSIESGTDVVAFLRNQHEAIRVMFRVTLGARGPERIAAFVALRRMLAVHETAEEQIVHPAARATLHGGETIVHKRLVEETEAKKMLVEIETIPPESPDFHVKLTILEAAVNSHADAEEREELGGLVEALDDRRLERMRRAAEFAEAVAPTRPHPSLESATTSVLVGPFAAMVDRARDALQGKR
jgi:hypothetical protein